MKSSPISLHWGIIGTGAIAKTFARALSASTCGTLVAIGSRSQESADTFADEFNVPHRHATYQELLDNPDVQAVYISTPHPLHAQNTIAAARAGKHILCEKPLAMNLSQAQTMVEACENAGVILMEAFMYRCHPQTAKLVELLRDDAIGKIKMLNVSFGFQAGFNAESRLFNRALGGGGILDVGCYTMSMARLIASVTSGRDFTEPNELKAVGYLGQSGVDEWTSATLKFDGDIIAQLSCGVNCNLENAVRIYGERGNIHIPSPWFCGPTDGQIKIMVSADGKTREEIVEAERELYEYEIEAFARAVEGGQVLAPAMSAQDALGNARALDLWRAQIGLEYRADTPHGWAQPLGGALRVEKRAPMRYKKVRGLDKEISQLVLGTMLEGALNQNAHAPALFDQWIEAGGNAFDTAHIYAGGAAEKLFGDWLKSRGVRDDIVILGKGAHTPHCDPAGLNRELDESLERMQVSGVDIYMMHRDNPDVPVGEFIDVLNEHQRAGRIGIFGGSNWSIKRIAAANEYAQAHKLNGFVCASNNFSLARLVEPMWQGCISSSDAEARSWFQEHEIALFAWSSQARGFFVRGKRDFTSDEELVRCWYSEDNFERLGRVQVLAERKNVSPINIAAAYVLNQEFPIFALIGPRALSEIRTSLPALEIELSKDERAWLNLESDVKPV